MTLLDLYLLEYYAVILIEPFLNWPVISRGVRSFLGRTGSCPSRARPTGVGSC